MMVSSIPKTLRKTLNGISLILLWLQSGFLFAERPNVLVILTDDQGYHDVSYYGVKDLRTPAIDELANSGMRFDNFYSNSSVCSPTRASLLTGRLHDLVGVQGVIRQLPDNTWGYWNPKSTSLADVLSDNGYQTALVGKWHLGLESPNLPNERGFKYFKGFLAGMMDYYTHLRLGVNFMRENQQAIEPKGHATDLFTQWATEYIGRASKKESPFFLYLAYNAPHGPIQPPEDWYQKVLDREPGISDNRAKYVALLEHLDSGIGKVIQALRDNDVYDDTVIIYSSDNGGVLAAGSDNGPLRDGKGSMYEGGLRVPTVVTWENKIENGTVTNHPGMTMDIFPTILDLCEIKWKGTVDGISFAPTLFGESVDISERAMIFSRREGGNVWRGYAGKTGVAVRVGDYKLLQTTPYNPMELYNIMKDPYETKDLLTGKTSSQYGKLAEFMDLQGRWAKHMQDRGRVPYLEPLE